MSTKIKSINIEINGQAQELSIEDARELHKVLGEVLNLNKPKQQEVNKNIDKSDSIAALVKAMQEAESQRNKEPRRPIYIPYPVPTYPAYPRHYDIWCKQDALFEKKESKDDKPVRFLGCTIM